MRCVARAAGNSSDGVAVVCGDRHRVARVQSLVTRWLRQIRSTTEVFPRREIKSIVDALSDHGKCSRRDRSERVNEPNVR
jgi:hypothetical protein